MNDKAIARTKSQACGLCCTKLESLGVTIGKTEILKDINLHIHCGELTALIGPNGAGKTTLLKAIMGEIPHSGTLRFLDIKDCHTRKPLIGYVPQKLEFDPGAPISVLDFFSAGLSTRPIFFGHTSRQRDHAAASLSVVHADHLLERRLGDLSGGELQRVLLALALDPCPDLLLMDEPVSGVDSHGREIFYNMVSNLRQQYDLSIILVSHDLVMVSRYADRVVFVDRTLQCVGTPEEVFNNEKIKRDYGYVYQESIKGKQSSLNGHKIKGVSA
ncbi:MAG: metal ABC transporter ATP-binding protein [Desulfotomaculaceae bacterium]|nr:metal ABC transporter ATP-binding protein [Desulfotomaculaceae bacterium]MDD4767188.1 metal ABC transporter ATP-binding protein [Desulfotomaculaceae bacterium]